MKADELRSEKRVGVCYFAEVINRQQETDGLVLNISYGGMMVRTQNLAQKGDRIVVRYENESGTFIHAGKVMWAEESGEDRLCGVRLYTHANELAHLPAPVGELEAACTF